MNERYHMNVDYHTTTILSDNSQILLTAMNSTFLFWVIKRPSIEDLSSLLAVAGPLLQKEFPNHGDAQ